MTKHRKIIRRLEARLDHLESRIEILARTDSKYGGSILFPNGARRKSAPQVENDPTSAPASVTFRKRNLKKVVASLDCCQGKGINQPVSSRFETSLNGVTILVVEDHDDARRYVELFLRQLGANVIAARNGVEGMEAVKAQSPAVVLTDILMPGGDGFQLLREIRAFERGREAVMPVIAMSALVSPADGRRILDAGFNAYLRKPFTPDRLFEAILSVLNLDR